MSLYSEDIADEEKLSCEVSFVPTFEGWELNIDMHCMRRDNAAAIQLVISREQIPEIAKSLAILVQMMLLESAKAEVLK